MNKKYIPIFLPAVIGYGTHLMCKIDEDSGSNVEFRPSPWVFRIVWPILYFLMGVAWFQARTVAKKKSLRLVDTTNLAFSLILSLWIVAYACRQNKIEGMYIILASIMTCLVVYTSSPLVSKMLLCPVLTWLIFALLLNIREIEKEQSVVV